MKPQTEYAVVRGLNLGGLANSMQQHQPVSFGIEGDTSIELRHISFSEAEEGGKVCVKGVIGVSGIIGANGKAIPADEVNVTIPDYDPPTGTGTARLDVGQLYDVTDIPVSIARFDLDEGWVQWLWGGSARIESAADWERTYPDKYLALRELIETDAGLQVRLSAHDLSDWLDLPDIVVPGAWYGVSVAPDSKHSFLMEASFHLNVTSDEGLETYLALIRQMPPTGFTVNRKQKPAPLGPDADDEDRMYYRSSLEMFHNSVLNLQEEGMFAHRHLNEAYVQERCEYYSWRQAAT